MAELRMTVNVRFVNNTNHAEDISDQQFTASREYNASQQLSSVQEELVKQMIDEIVEQIFNATEPTGKSKNDDTTTTTALD